MKAEEVLLKDQTRGWRLGIRNLFARENQKWWNTSRWLIQTVVWGVITNGILVLLLFVMPLIVDLFPNVDQAQLDSLPTGLEMFFSLAGLAFPIGVVILIQGSLINEKELGTAEWILSKPVSRSAFVLSKFFSHALGILTTMVLFQSAFAYGLIWLNQGSPLPVWAFVKGIGVLAIMLFFYLSLVLMMEVLSDKRGTVLAVGLGSALGGMLLVQLLPFLVYVTPFALGNFIPLIVLDSPPENFPVWMPILTTTVMGFVFLITAVRLFNQKK